MFHREEVLDLAEEKEAALFKLARFQARLKAQGIDVAGFESWPKVDELRLVAGATKHAEDGSSAEPRARRPDLFERPELVKTGAALKIVVPRIFQPLAGEDLYVSIEDIRAYRDALLGFWGELAEALPGA